MFIWVKKPEYRSDTKHYCIICCIILKSTFIRILRYLKCTGVHYRSKVCGQWDTLFYWLINWLREIHYYFYAVMLKKYIYICHTALVNVTVLDHTVRVPRYHWSVLLSGCDVSSHNVLAKSICNASVNKGPWNKSCKHPLAVTHCFSHMLLWQLCVNMKWLLLKFQQLCFCCRYFIPLPLCLHSCSSASSKPRNASLGKHAPKAVLCHLSHAQNVYNTIRKYYIELLH